MHDISLLHDMIFFLLMYFVAQPYIQPIIFYFLYYSYVDTAEKIILDPDNVWRFETCILN